VRWRAGQRAWSTFEARTPETPRRLQVLPGKMKGPVRLLDAVGAHSPVDRYSFMHPALARGGIPDQEIGRAPEGGIARVGREPDNDAAREVRLAPVPLFRDDAGESRGR
jgi:hypothetical protein